MRFQTLNYLLTLKRSVTVLNINQNDVLIKVTVNDNINMKRVIKLDWLRCEI